MQERRQSYVDGEKRCNPRHRGRRGQFWGDPGHGQPGSCESRAALDRAERAAERRVRQRSRQLCEEGHLDYLYGEE